MNLSDGGHFDNLGIYELVRRRCACIIACDGEEDANLKFSGLGSVIRKCRVDLGAEIDLQVSELIRDPDRPNSTAHCVVGEIRYPGTDFTSRLIYLKASLTGDESVDVLEYKLREQAFPHHSTADQFFDESQFESYRAVGHHIATKALERAVRGKSFINPAHFQDFMAEVKSQWTPPPTAGTEAFIHAAKQLDTIRQNFQKQSPKNSIAMLGQELFPGNAAVASPARYTILGLIQHMENVFLHLKLESEGDHPVNRGWISLFREWVRHPDFRSVWADNKHTFGGRFQLFCRDELDLP